MNKFFTFVFGAALGALGALLMAPRSGQETREIVADQANAALGNAQEFGEQAINTLQGGLKQATVKGQELMGNVKDAANKGMAEAVDKNDELRSKIEAARERIAQQVKNNAEETAETAKETTEAAKNAADEMEKQHEKIAEL